MLPPVGRGELAAVQAEDLERARVDVDQHAGGVDDQDPLGEHAQH
ncbi:MAG TPA: hypothetical protein VII87_04820 [Solirubrobacteraceae bacterium]